MSLNKTEEKLNNYQRYKKKFIEENGEERWKEYQKLKKRRQRLEKKQEGEVDEEVKKFEEEKQEVNNLYEGAARGNSIKRPVRHDIEKYINTIRKTIIKSLSGTTPLAQIDKQNVKQKQKETIKTLKNVKNCSSLVEKLATVHNTKKSTTKTYKDNISTLYFKYTGKNWDCKSFDFLIDYKKLIHFIEIELVTRFGKKYADNSIKTFYTSIVKLTASLDEKYQVGLEAYTNQMNKYGKTTEFASSTGQLTKSTLQRYTELTVIQKAFKENVNKLKNNMYKLLALFYVGLPCRRLKEYQVLYMVEAGRFEEENNQNYLVVNNFREKKPIMFMFNHHKTEDSSPSILRFDDLFEYTKKVGMMSKSTFMRYYNEFIKGTKGNKLVFHQESSDDLPISNASQRVSKIFKTLTGKNLTVNLLRHAHATRINDNRISYQTRKFLAEAMGHSVETNTKYVVIK